MEMRPPRPKLANAELKVVEALWSFGPQTIRELAARLYPGGATSDYATVQKLLERLEAKAFVLRDRSAVAHVFRAAVSREACLDAQLQDMADKLCEGSLTTLLLHLAERVVDQAAARRTPGHARRGPEEIRSSKGRSPWLTKPWRIKFSRFSPATRWRPASSF